MTTNYSKGSQPLNDKLMILQDEAPAATPGGIVLPNQATEKPNRGLVIRVGPGKLLADGARGPLAVKVGDTVIYGQYAGVDVTLGDTTYVVLSEDDVLVVIKP